MKEKLKIPKYWYVKKDETNPLWKKLLKWIEERNNSQFWIGLDNYYGYDGSEGYNGFNCENLIDDFQNNPKRITLDFWDEYIKNNFGKEEQEEQEKPKKYIILKDFGDEIEIENKKARNYLLREGIIKEKEELIEVPDGIVEYKNQMFSIYNGKQNLYFNQKHGEFSIGFWKKENNKFFLKKVKHEELENGDIFLNDLDSKKEFYSYNIKIGEKDFYWKKNGIIDYKSSLIFNGREIYKVIKK